MSEVLSVTMPPLLKREVEAASKTGYYDNGSEFVRDAIRTLLSSRKDVRLAIAMELYGEGIISIGKFTEIAELSYDEAKRLLRSRGLKIRAASRSLSDLGKELKAFKKRK